MRTRLYRNRVSNVIEEGDATWATLSSSQLSMTILNQISEKEMKLNFVYSRTDLSNSGFCLTFITRLVTLNGVRLSCLKMFFLLMMINLRYCLLMAMAWNSHI